MASNLLHKGTQFVGQSSEVPGTVSFRRGDSLRSQTILSPVIMRHVSINDSAVPFETDATTTGTHPIDLDLP